MDITLREPKELELLSSSYPNVFSPDMILRERIALTVPGILILHTIGFAYTQQLVIRMIVVNASCRRKGYGTRAIKPFLELADHASYTTVANGVLKRVRAEAFWTHNGFRPLHCSSQSRDWVRVVRNS